MNKRVRRIDPSEKDSKRQWPKKKWLASENPEPVQQHGQKNRIHSVLVALPVFMLIVGLVIYFRGESAQNNGAFVLAEISEREVLFKSVSKVSGIGKAKHYLWVTEGDRQRGFRIAADQVQEFEAFTGGEVLQVETGPRVPGSKTSWVYTANHEGMSVIDLSKVN